MLKISENALTFSQRMDPLNMIFHHVNKRIRKLPSNINYKDIIGGKK